MLKRCNVEEYAMQKIATCSYFFIAPSGEGGALSISDFKDIKVTLQP